MTARDSPCRIAHRSRNLPTPNFADSLGAMSRKTLTMAWNPRALVSKTFKIVAKDGPHLTIPAPHERRAVRARHTSDAPPAVSAVRQAIVRTRQWLLEQQHPDGYWVGELEGDTILESEYILLLAWLGREAVADRAQVRQLPPRQATARRRLGHVSRRHARYQRQREGLFRPEAHRPRSASRVHAARPRGDSRRTAAPTR